MTKITNRIKQIDYSLQQAQQMLESMDKFKHLVVSIILEFHLHDMLNLLILFFSQVHKNRAKNSVLSLPILKNKKQAMLIYSI